MSSRRTPPSLRGSRPGRVAATSAVLACLSLVAACGDDPAGDGTPSSAVETAANGDVFNQADVDFATAMIPHHAQAIQMVTLTDGRTLDPAVLELANGIREAQAPEVETMVDWLVAWGKEVPETSLDHTNAGHHGGEAPDMGDMPGMLSSAEMEALAGAPDGEFQDRWLEMMAEHHEGAIEMARHEQEHGRFPEAIALADSVVASQQAEIERIAQLRSG